MSESWFCRQNGCQMNRLGPMAEAAQDALRQARKERVTALSGALWCDLGEHAFSSRDRKRATYKIETFDEETGEPIDDQLTACGPHAAERRASLAPRASLPPGADKELYTEFLEWKAGLNQAAEPADDHG
jgi:hypothetical protein